MSGYFHTFIPGLQQKNGSGCGYGGDVGYGSGGDGGYGSSGGHDDGGHDGGGSNCKCICVSE